MLSGAKTGLEHTCFHPSDRQQVSIIDMVTFCWIILNKQRKELSRTGCQMRHLVAPYRGWRVNLMPYIGLGGAGWNRLEHSSMPLNTPGPSTPQGGTRHWFQRNGTGCARTPPGAGGTRWSAATGIRTGRLVRAERAGYRARYGHRAFSWAFLGT